MSKILDWIKKHVWQTILIGVALFLVPLVFVHFIYKWQTPYFLLQSDWSSGELITYIAGFEAFVGTVFLGSISLKQNHQIIEMNDRLLKIEETSSQFQRYPNLKAENTKVIRTSLKDMSSLEGLTFWSQDLAEKTESMESNILLEEPFNHYSFYLKNLSNFIVTIHVEDIELHSLLNERTPILFETKNVGLMSNNNVIAPGQSIQLGFVVFDFDFDFESFLICDANISIFIENNMNEKFKCIIGFQILNTSPNFHFKIRGEKTYPVI